MTTPRKAAANRANALRSTGPKTPDGKAAASRNAIRHGILSRAVLMAGEDGLALNALRAELRAALEPVGAVEELLTDHLVSVVWRLRRAQGMESGVLTDGFLDALTRHGHHDLHGLGLRTVGGGEGQKPVLAVAENYAAGAALRYREADGPALERAARYGGALERSMIRTLHEIERVQARRLGQDVPLPLALDVTADHPTPH